MALPEGMVRYVVTILVDEDEYEGADDVIEMVDALLPEGMEVVSAEVDPSQDTEDGC